MKERPQLFNPVHFAVLPKMASNKVAEYARKMREKKLAEVGGRAADLIDVV